MENAKSLALAAAAILVAGCTLSVNATPAVESPEWSMYRGDLARDGHPASATLDSAAARRLTLAWSARLEGAVDGTPAIAQGLVVAGSIGGQLAAFDERTGRLAWTVAGVGPISGSPAIDGGRVLFGTLDGHVRAYAVASGKPLWDWTAPGDHPAIWSSPAIYRGLVVIGSASPYGDAPLEPGRMFGLDETSGQVLWSVCMRAGCAAGDGVWSTPSFDGAGVGYVGVGNPDDGVRAFDVATGKLKWDVSLYTDAGRDLDVGASPVVVTYQGREALAVSATSGLLALLDARDGTSIWESQLVAGSAVHGLLASPAYDGVALYAASASAPTGLFAVAAGGTARWMHATGLPVYSAPVVGRGVVVFGTGAVFGDLTTGTLTALSTADGSLLWMYDAHSAVRSSPAIAGDLVAVGDYAGDLLAFRPAA